MKAWVYHILCARKYFIFCVNKISVGWMVFFSFCFFSFLLPFYGSFFRVTFLKGGDQLLVVHWSNVYWRKYIFLLSRFLAGHHNYQMPSYRTQFSRKWHLASWQSPQALVLMVLEMQLGLGGCWGSYMVHPVILDAIYLWLTFDSESFKHLCLSLLLSNISLSNGFICIHSQSGGRKPFPTIPDFLSM